MQKTLSLWMIVGGLLFGSTFALAQSTPPSAIFGPTTNSPSISLFFHFISCYDVITGNSLNCAVYDQLVGLVPPLTDATNTGGHLNHQRPAPLTDGNAGALGFLCVTCPDSNPDPLIIQTFTNFGTDAIVHQVPQFAGRIQVQQVITPPPGWSCVNTCSFQFVEEIAVDGLSELSFPGPNNSYTNSRQPVPDPLHPKGSSGTSDTLTGIAAIAQGYLAQKKVGLRINDLSLPQGGKFDLAGAYGESDDHQGHRRGKEVDIGHQDIAGNPTNCFKAPELKKLLKSNGVVFQLCETGPRSAFHIRFN